MNPEDRERYCDLAGVSVEAVVIDRGGLGAPVSREASRNAPRAEWSSHPADFFLLEACLPPVYIDLAPDQDITAPLRDQNARRDTAAAKLALRRALPNRLADRWVDLHPPAGWTNRSISGMERRGSRWKFVPAGTEGYDKAEVTVGGVDTRNSRQDHGKP